MTKKPNLKTITSGYAATTALNENFEALRDALDNTVSRDGSVPNSMSADLDMNSQDILNANVIAAGSLTLNGTLVVPSGVDPVFSGTVTDFMVTLLDDENAATARATLGAAATSHTHVIADITDFTDSSTNWNTAYGWGDHSLAGYIEPDTDDNLTAGYTATAVDDGTFTTQYRPTPVSGNFRIAECQASSGNSTLLKPNASGNYTLIVHLTNTNAHSGFIIDLPSANISGDTVTNAAGDEFFLYWTKLNGIVTLSVKALQ